MSSKNRDDALSHPLPNRPPKLADGSAALVVGISLTRSRVPVHPSCCPPTIPTDGCRFPPAGPVGSVPRLPRYYQQLRLPRLRPAALVVLARPYHLVPEGSLRQPSDTTADDQGRCCPAAPHSCRFVKFGGETRASQVPGEPPCVHALLSDPGGTIRARPLRHARTAFRHL